MKVRKNLLLLFIYSILWNNAHAQILLKKTISGKISPKSIAHNGKGVFFAQNMLYKHSITVYNDNYELKKTISDKVDLSKYGYDGTVVKGGPVEAAFSHEGKYAWISNYSMDGTDYSNPGCDNCYGKNHDKGFVYKINTETLNIENIYKVGSIPKFIAVSPNNSYVLVSNWTSGDLSIISTEKDSVIRTIDIGKFPRGIAIDSKSNYAYVSIMGSSKIIIVNLSDFSTSTISDIGRAPRHLCIDSNDQFLYCSINKLNKIVKIDLNTNLIVGTANTGKAPRSMILSPDNEFIYVVNYFSNTFSKINTSDMSIIDEIETKKKPIGITLNCSKQEIWVACYSGYIQIFTDSSIKMTLTSPELDFLNLLASYSNIIEMYGKRDPRIKSNVTSIKITDLNKENSQPKPTSESTNQGFIIVGSFTVKSNAIRMVKKLKKEHHTVQLVASKKAGSTYVAIPINESPETELIKIKQEITSSAWIYSR